MKDLNQLRELSVEELQKEIQSLEKSLYTLRIGTQAKKEKQNHLINLNKKQVARINTILREKTLQNTIQ